MKIECYGDFEDYIFEILDGYYKDKSLDYWIDIDKLFNDICKDNYVVKTWNKTIECDFKDFDKYFSLFYLRLEDFFKNYNLNLNEITDDLGNNFYFSSGKKETYTINLGKNNWCDDEENLIYFKH